MVTTRPVYFRRGSRPLKVEVVVGRPRGELSVGGVALAVPLVTNAASKAEAAPGAQGPRMAPSGCGCVGRVFGQTRRFPFGAGKEGVVTLDTLIGKTGPSVGGAGQDGCLGDLNALLAAVAI